MVAMPAILPQDQRWERSDFGADTGAENARSPCGVGPQPPRGLLGGRAGPRGRHGGRSAGPRGSTAVLAVRLIDGQRACQVIRGAAAPRTAAPRITRLLLIATGLAAESDLGGVGGAVADVGDGHLRAGRLASDCGYQSVGAINRGVADLRNDVTFLEAGVCGRTTALDGRNLCSWGGTSRVLNRHPEEGTG